MDFLTRLLAAMIVVAGIGCQASSRQTAGHELTRTEALALAVELANEECEVRYSATPFTITSYEIVFVDGRWSWGTLDHAGDQGFSAVVSFGARGEDREVEVFLSTDMLMPRDLDDEQRDQ